jgi:hypothetical protein
MTGRWAVSAGSYAGRKPTLMAPASKAPRRRQRGDRVGTEAIEASAHQQGAESVAEPFRSAGRARAIAIRNIGSYSTAAKRSRRGAALPKRGSEYDGEAFHRHVLHGLRARADVSRQRSVPETPLRQLNQITQGRAVLQWKGETWCAASESKSWTFRCSGISVWVRRGGCNFGRNASIC